MAKRVEKDLGFWVNALPDPISNSPYCLSCNWENLVLDQFIRPKFKIFFILITCLLDIVLILKGEILSRSLGNTIFSDGNRHGFGGATLET